MRDKNPRGNHVLLHNARQESPAPGVRRCLDCGTRAALAPRRKYGTLVAPDITKPSRGILFAAGLRSVAVSGRGLLPRAGVMFVGRLDSAQLSL
jgi:hypothetical protein